MALALLAGICMVVQDILGTVMVQAQARNRGLIAGMADAAMWLFGIQTTTLAVQAHGSGRVLVDAIVTVANVLGAWLGVYIGRRLLKRFPSDQPSVEDRLDRMERIIGTRGP